MCIKIKSETISSDKIVSVIIPVYNAGKYLSACLDSLQAQTYPHWQAVLVNDGSTDNSLKILHEYAIKDKRFIIIDQKNAGVSAARNAALRTITGEYTIFLDSDDMLFCQFMEYMVSALENTNSDMAWCLVEKQKSQLIKNKYKQCNCFITKNILKYFLKRQKPKISIAVWGRIYKTKILKDIYFDKNFKQMAEDFYYSFLVFERIRKAVCVTEKLLFYRQTENSLSHKKFSETEVDDHLLLAEKLMTHFATFPQKQVYKDISVMLARIIFRECCTYPYLQKVAYKQYWEKYQKRCQNLVEQKIFYPQMLGWFKYFLYQMFSLGQFKKLEFWLKLYCKVRRKI